MNIPTIISQLKLERDRLNDAIQALEGSGNHGAHPGGLSSRRRLSVAARNKIAAAQRARWARIRGNAVSAKNVVKMPKKRTMSAAALHRIRAAQKKRWATWRKQKSKN